MVEVSVITAAYNSEEVIERNIRSVGGQMLQAKEHIIVDDGSVDGTVSVVEGLQREFPNIRIIKQAHAGAAEARNTGIQEASGRFIAFLDSDDIWGEQKLAAQTDFMLRQGVSFSYGDYDIIDAAQGRVSGRYRSPAQVTHGDLMRGCSIGCLTVAYDQKKLGKRFMPNVARGQDWGLWLELTRDGSAAHRYPGCHAQYFRRANSLSSAKFAKLMDVYQIYRRQEQIGPARSLYYVLRHAITSLST